MIKTNKHLRVIIFGMFLIILGLLLIVNYDLQIVNYYQEHVRILNVSCFGTHFMIWPNVPGPIKNWQ